MSTSADLFIEADNKYRQRFGSSQACIDYTTLRYPNVYGIDMPTHSELIAHNRSSEEIRRFIGADALIYQDIAAMKKVVAALNPAIRGFEASCFDGVYITGDVTADDFATLAAQRRSQGEEEEGADRSRLVLQGATEQGP